MTNASALVAGLVQHKYATLAELQTIYSYRDALDLYEIMIVNHYNEWVIHEEASRRR